MPLNRGHWISDIGHYTTILMINILLLRLDPAYMYYYIHWTRLLTTGIVPFAYLVYMNMRIYCRHVFHVSY